MLVQSLVVVTDSFSDTELLCDLLEASRKRNVSVYLLLDLLNLDLFLSTWKDHQLDSKDFPKLSVRSVQGQTYCSKTGRKLTGQIAESFIITDGAEVLTGSYSFTWLSWQVHRSLAVLLKGSPIKPFHQEFHRLYSCSESVAGFVTFLPAPLTPHLHSSTAAQNSDVGKQRSKQIKTVHHWEGNGARRQSWTNSTTTLLTGEAHGENGDNQPSLLQTCLAEPGAKGKKQSPAVEKPQNTTAPDQTSSSVVPHLISCSISPAAEKNKWIKEPNTASKYEWLQKKTSNLSPHGFHAFRHSGFPEASNKQGHWNKLNFQQNREVPPDNSNFYTALQANPILQSAFSSSRSQAPGLLSSQPNSDFSCQQPARMVTHLKTQAELKLYLPGSSAKTPLQTCMYQRGNLQRSNWPQQNYPSVGPRDVVRHHSFSGIHVTEQLGWRPLQRTVNASLERSKSMNERGTAGH
uniref:Scaffolding anchor of CK1 domain-containing protein n=2 Tax=Oryzias sinensis TaxID=183150 RepID=A0A8C7YCK2_9TELE